MNLRIFSSGGTGQHMPLRNSSSDTNNYLSTQRMNPLHPTDPHRTLTSTNSSTFTTPNIHHVRPLNTYCIASDFSSNSPSNNNATHHHHSFNINNNDDTKYNINPYASNTVHQHQQQQQQQQQQEQMILNNRNDRNAGIPTNLLLPDSLHHSSSAPYIASLLNKKRKHNQAQIGIDINSNNDSPYSRDTVDTDNINAYNASFNIINGDILNIMDDEEDDEESISYLDNDVLEAVNIESSSASRSIYTNTPSVIPLVSAFRGISSKHLMVKPCSERFDVGVIMLTLSQILNYLTLKLFYPFAGFIYPVLNITYLEFVFFISLSNIGTFFLFLIQPMFEYFATNYVLFLLQFVMIISSIFFLLFSSYLYMIIFCRMIFIFCLNSIWVQTNGAIRSFTINNIVVNSRRNLLLHSSWQISTFLLCLLGYIWSIFNNFDAILFGLMAPTFIFSVSYLILIPAKKLRIKYLDESCFDVMKRTWSYIMNDIMHIIKIKYVNLLVLVNIFGAINSMMILFIFGIWLQNLLNLDIMNVALYTLIQAISELFVMIVNLNKCINRKKLSVLSAIISIIFVIILFTSSYITLYINNQNNKWYYKWFNIINNKYILIISLFGIFFGHETFVATVNSCIFRECRKHNTPNAAYPLWNIIGSFATFIGQLFVGILWVYAGNIYSILIILIIMFIIDVIALFTLIYALMLYKKR